MKKLLFFVTVCLLLGVIFTPAYASQDIKVILDDEILSFDVPPVIRDGRTLVPVRQIVEAMGGEIDYNPVNRTVTIVNDEKIIVLAIDSNLAKVDEQDIILDVPATILGGRTNDPITVYR